MVTRNRKKLFDLCIKSHTIKLIWKCGNDIVSAQRGKFVFSRILITIKKMFQPGILMRLQYAKAEDQYIKKNKLKRTNKIFL